MNNNEELKSVEQKVEDAHQRLLSIDQQYYRVQKLHESELASIASLQQIKIDLETSITILTDNKKTLELEISNLGIEKESINNDITQSREMFITLHKQIDEDTNKHNEQKNILKDANDAVDIKTVDILAREELLKENERIVNEKHSKIKKLANEII